MEETPDQLRAIAASLGWELAALEADGRWSSSYTSPVELSTDRFLNDATDEVRRSAPAVWCSTASPRSALGVPSERRFKELVYAISKHMRSLGASLLMTSESQQLLGARR